MSLEGVLDCYTTTDTIEADTFKDFATNSLGKLQPFNGTNPTSVVVLDNCSIHHVDAVIQAIHSTGAIVQFLPIAQT